MPAFIPVFRFARALAVMVGPALLASGPAGATIVRCTAPDGSVSYQDSSCARGSKGVPVDETANRGFRFADPKDVERLRRERAAEKAREMATYPAIRSRTVRSGKAPRVPFNAGERRFITAGMASSEVRARIGAPDQISRSTASSKSNSKEATQRWIYLPAAEDPQTTTILTIRGGVVALVDRRIGR